MGTIKDYGRNFALLADDCAMLRTDRSKGGSSNLHLDLELRTGATVQSARRVPAAHNRVDRVADIRLVRCAIRRARHWWRKPCRFCRSQIADFLIPHAAAASAKVLVGATSRFLCKGGQKCSRNG